MPRPTTILLLPADRPKLSQLIFFLLGCLTTLAFEPFGLSLLVPLVLVPFLYVCLTNSPRDSAKHGFWFGFGLFLSGTYWIYISVVVFGQAPVWIALFLMISLVLIMSVYFWLTAWLISRLAHGEPWYLFFVAPAAWVIVEWARGWLFTGFPWMALGYSQIDSALAGWAPVLGVYGVSALVVLSAAALLVVMMTRGRQQIVAIALVLAPVLTGAILKAVDWTEPDGEALTATIIQGGVSQDRKWLREEFLDAALFGQPSREVAPVHQVHHRIQIVEIQVVGGAHPGENPVHNADFSVFRRYVGPDLGHEHQQGHLPQISGFSRHVRARDDVEATAAVVQFRVVGDEMVDLGEFLDDGVAAALDPYDGGIGNEGFCVPVVVGHMGEG